VIVAELSTDPAAGIGIFAALAAGVVSFLSPCVLPLVPGYLSAVSGVSAAELDSAGWRRVLGPSLLFVASFSAIFIALGLTATGLGATLQDHKQLLIKISAALIIAMGVLFVASLGAAMMMLWSQVIVGSGFSLDQQRNQGTLELLVAAPVPLVIVIAPVMIASAAFGIYGLLVTLAWGRFAFGIPIAIDHPVAFVVAAVAAGALDRAVDVAATLEVRGYGAAARPARAPRPWSRHDLAFAAAAAAVVALTAAAWLGGWARFEAYPTLEAPVTAPLLVLLGALAAVALAPFADRRGVGR